MSSGPGEREQEEQREHDQPGDRRAGAAQEAGAVTRRRRVITRSSAISVTRILRVEDGVDDVGEEAGEQHEHGDEQAHRRDRVDVVARHRVDEPLAHPVPAEDLLGERRADDAGAARS